MSGAMSAPRIWTGETLGHQSRAHELNHSATGPAPYQILKGVYDPKRVKSCCFQRQVTSPQTDPVRKLFREPRFLSLKIFSTHMDSVNLGCHGCCGKRGSVPTNCCLWIWYLRRTLTKYLATSFTWSWIDLKFSFCLSSISFFTELTFIFWLLHSGTFIDSLLPTTSKLDIFTWWFVEGLLNLTHLATLVLFSTSWLHRFPLVWPLCVRTFYALIQTVSLRAQKIRPIRKVMLNAWWQVSSFPDAKYLKCHYSHHRAYFLCHLDSLGCQNEFPSGADISFAVSWDKPSECMLTRTVSTRKLWNQYHLNPNSFSSHDRLFLVSLNASETFMLWPSSLSFMTVQLFLWKLVMLAAFFFSMLTKGL